MREHVHATLLDAIGNPPAVAKLVISETGEKITRQAVNNWRRRGISHRFRNVIARIARTRGVADRIPVGFIME